MCGIAGAVNFQLSYDTIRSEMFHRGPDEQNAFSQDNVSFYHLRLSILDKAGGVQPMHLDNRFTIIFNGQIYNHNTLREEFKLEGKSYSDTETLLMLYRKLGADMLNLLEGMFAFAIYDNKERTLFIARDRAGKKPLYIYNDGVTLLFSSELNCLKSMVKLEMNENNFYHYFHFGTFYRKLTPYKNVEELTAGTSLMIDCNTMKVKEKQWWNIRDHYINNSHDDLNTSSDKVKTILKQAVKSRINSSDLEVGCFLSGGIDSGIITALAAENTKNLKTFTVSFPGAYDEAPLAKLVSEKYGTNHTQIALSFDNLRNDVERIIMNYGEPFFDSSAIPSYYVSQAAKKYVTVILNGDGADELFGGYRRYVPFAKYDFFKTGSIVRNMAGMAEGLLPASHDKKSRYNLLYRLVSLASKKDIRLYLSAGLDIIEGYENNIINPGFDYLKTMKDDLHVITNSSLTGLQKIMCMDFDSTLFNDLLVKMDIATMANSLEGRSPFLCKELLEYVPGLQDKHKINGTTTKVILRNIAKEYLPGELINQPKRGFEVPLKSWINNDLKEMIFDYLAKPGALYRNYFKNGFVEKLMNNQIKIPAEKRAKILWTLFCMEVWYQKIYKAS